MNKKCGHLILPKGLLKKWLGLPKNHEIICIKIGKYRPDEIDIIISGPDLTEYGENGEVSAYTKKYNDSIPVLRITELKNRKRD